MNWEVPSAKPGGGGMAGGECNAMRGSRKECGCVEKCAAACGKIGGGNYIMEVVFG